MGDGGFSMLMAEFATCVKYRLPIKVVIVKNNTLGHDQVGADGVPRQSRNTACDLQPIDFAAFARACGATGFTIEDPAQCGACWTRRSPRRAR